MKLKVVVNLLDLDLYDEDDNLQRTFDQSNREYQLQVFLSGVAFGAKEDVLVEFKNADGSNRQPKEERYTHEE